MDTNLFRKFLLRVISTLLLAIVVCRIACANVPRAAVAVQGFADQLDRSVLPDYPDLLDSLVRRGSLVLREVLDSRDQLDRLERQGSVELLVFQEASAELVRK